MLTRRFVLTGLIAAPAVIAAEKLMPVHSLPQRYATVWGVGHDLKVVEHVIWEPTSIMAFGMSDHMDQFREVTAWEYGFPVKPMPKPVTLPHWHRDPAPDPMTRFDRPADDSQGMTNIVSFNRLGEWQESLRPELGSRYGKEWAEEVMRTNEANGLPKYHGVNWKWCPDA
jgi:hypothetical protein